jgi:RNA polymerase sigma-70 factor (ECF subfamily)
MTEVRTPPASDDELLGAFRRSDSGAVEALHARIRPEVERTIRRLLGTADIDREDMVQQAFAEILGTIHTFRGACSLDSWVHAVAAHVVYKHIRRRRLERRFFESGDAAARAEARSASRPATEAIVRQVMQRLRDHFRKLGDSKTATILLHDACGYDLRETASLTGVTVAAAQTRLVRGRRELHRRIARDPELVRWFQGLRGEP